MDHRSRYAPYTRLSERATMSSFNPDIPQPGRKRPMHNPEDDDDDVTFLYTAPVKRARTSQTEVLKREYEAPKQQYQAPQRESNLPTAAEFREAVLKRQEAKRDAILALPPGEEKRLRRFRPKPPQSYMEIKERALTQRFTVLSRERCGIPELPEEKIVMAGTTGNVYTQTIRLIPHCDCPHAKKGNQCKHLIYVMLRVLKAPEHTGYQLALLSTELRDLLARAPPIPGEDTAADEAASNEDGNRKPIEGDCPICYTEFDPAHESIVYCAVGCGNNVHKSCMQSWTRAKSGKATCPYCRAKWAEEETDAQIGNVDLAGVRRNEEGYLNVASQLGLSGRRDYSTYHEPWVNRHRYARY